MVKIDLNFLLLYIALFSIAKCTVMITPPNVGDLDHRNIATPDELETNVLLPDQIDSSLDTSYDRINADDEVEPSKRMLSSEVDSINDNDNQKIEIIPKATEISYEVKVTNVLPDDTNAVDLETMSKSKQGNLRKIVSETLSDKTKDISKIQLIDVDKEESNNKATNHSINEPVNPTGINIIDPEEIYESGSDADDEGSDSNFEEDPPIDVNSDSRLEFGLINVFPLSKLYSVYLKGEKNHKEFFDLPPNTLRKDVVLHPYNNKIMEVLNSLFDQVKFNHKHIDQMDKTLIGLDHDIMNVSKTIKFTPPNHKLLENMTLESKQSQDVWKKSFEYTKNKLIIMEESLDKVKQCMVGNSIDNCRKHFDTVFDLMNLLDIFSPGSTVCKYSSICKINLRKKVVELLRFNEVKRHYEIANKDIQKIVKFANNLNDENLKAPVVKNNDKKLPIVKINGKPPPIKQLINSTPLGVKISKDSNPIQDRIKTAKNVGINKPLVNQKAMSKKGSVNLHGISGFCAFIFMVFFIAF